MRLMARIEVQGLHVRFGETDILRGVDFSLEEGEVFGVVGESGCGKSMTGLALMGMVPRPGQVQGNIRLEGRELIGLSEREWQQIRGAQIAMVMQDPFSSLNPVMSIGNQVAEAIWLHQDVSKKEAWDRAVQWLGRVQLPQPEQIARSFPHQLSGGQRQRVVIAIAFACQPKVLVADEPTTALDVTLQAQVMQLLRDLQKEMNTSVVLISHDMGLIEDYSDRVGVFYAGRIVEQATAAALFENPRHPYTRALLDAIPRPDVDRLESIPGYPPRFADLKGDCSFAPRCKFKNEKCSIEPSLVGDEHKVACWNSELVQVQRTN